MKIKYQDLSLHYETYGKESNRCVILLHGFMENSGIWNPFIPLLEDHYFLLIPDLIGHGKSPGAGTIHTMPLYADSIRFLSDHHGITAADIIGHSMGGYIAMAIVDQDPSYCKNILLMNSIPGADSETRKRERERSIELVAKDQRRFAETAVNSYFVRSAPDSFKEDRDWFISEGMKLNPDDIIAALQGMKIRKDRTEVLKNFQGKKWIIAADADSLFPIEEVEEMARETGSDLFILPGGHMSHVEQREEVEKIMLEFLGE